MAAATMPGDGAVRNASTKPPAASSSTARKSAHSASTAARVQVADLADRLGRLVVADRGLAALPLEHALEDRVAIDVAARPPLPSAAEAAHPCCT